MNYKYSVKMSVEKSGNLGNIVSATPDRPHEASLGVNPLTVRNTLLHSCVYMYIYICIYHPIHTMGCVCVCMGGWVGVQETDI